VKDVLKKVNTNLLPKVFIWHDGIVRSETRINFYSSCKC